jgi:hypothetical protein
VYGGSLAEKLRVEGKCVTAIESYICVKIAELFCKALILAGGDNLELITFSKPGVLNPGHLFGGNTFTKVNYCLELSDDSKSQICLILPDEKVISLFQRIDERSNFPKNAIFALEKKDYREEVIALLSKSDAESLQRLFYLEHATVVAAVLAMLPPDTASNLLPLLPKALWNVFMTRVNSIHEVKQLGVESLYFYLNSSKDLLQNRNLSINKNAFNDIFTRLAPEVQQEISQHTEPVEEQVSESYDASNHKLAG